MTIQKWGGIRLFVQAVIFLIAPAIYFVFILRPRIWQDIFLWRSEPTLDSKALM